MLILGVYYKGIVKAGIGIGDRKVVWGHLLRVRDRHEWWRQLCPIHTVRAAWQCPRVCRNPHRMPGISEYAAGCFCAAGRAVGLRFPGYR